MIDDGNEIKYQGETSQDELTAITVINAVATIREIDPLNLPPLGEAISADALEMLVEEGNDVRITFAYEGLQISLDETGQIVIRDSE